MWGSHSDREPSSDAGRGRDSLGESDDSRKLRTELQVLLVCSGMDSSASSSVRGCSGNTTITNGTGGSAGGLEGSFGGGDGSIISRVAGIWRGKKPLSEGVGEGMFLMWTPGTWGEPMFTSGHFFSISATGVVGGCPKWPISGDTD